MGTCVSKCCSNPSHPFDPSPPQDKLVISQSPSTPTNPLPNDLSNTQSTPSSSTSSSSSSSSSSTSATYSCTSNSTYSQSSSKDRSFTNEFLLSCAKENPHIIILDPHKHCASKPKPNRHPVKASPRPFKSVQGPQKQPTAGANQSLPAKRGRSTSPPTLAAGRKSSKTELSSAVPPPCGKLSTPSPPWRSTNALTERQRRVVGTPGNAVPLQLAPSKEKLPCSSPYNLSHRQISSVEKRRAACMHQIHQTNSQMGRNGSREVFSQESSRIPPMEDLNNPLMYMDCFIFL